MKDSTQERPFIRLHKGIILYLLLFVFAILFTQALRSIASALLFWFVFLYPAAAFLYVLLGRLAIQVYVQAEYTRVEKMTPVPYEMYIVNASPLVFPFVDAILQMPQVDGIRCVPKRMRVCLLPLASSTVRTKTHFPYRGTYEIGMQCIYVSDFMQLFSIRLNVDIYTNILVMPRRLASDRKTKTSATDIPNDRAASVFITEKAEIGNIREYIPGDALKSIHWKLSSKTPEALMVKEFNTNTSRNVYVLCDFSRAIPPEVFEPEEKKPGSKKERKTQKKEEETVKPVLKSRGDGGEDVSVPRKKKRKKRSAAGEADFTMIDELIAGTATPTVLDTVRDRLGEKRREAAARQIAKMEKTMRDSVVSPEDTEEERGSLVMGGRIRSLYRDDMDEYCADGVAEMAIAVVQNELKQGNEVTLLWTDTRMDDGIAAAVLTCPEDFESLYETFATTPPCRNMQTVTELLPLIRESLNVTIRICTAQLDPVSIGKYGAIPSLFGGAGSGCLTEILLFNPEDRYENTALRREYVAMSKLQLAKDGVELTELSICTDEDGNTVLKEVKNG